MESHDQLQAGIMRMEEAFREGSSGRRDARSKRPVRPGNADARPFDFRRSIRRPKGYAEVHSREAAGSIPGIPRDRRIGEPDGVKPPPEPHTGIHVPPEGRHGLFRADLGDLVFPLTASLPREAPEFPRTGGRAE